jgi:parallel beta-helix repeat protein
MVMVSRPKILGIFLLAMPFLLLSTGDVSATLESREPIVISDDENFTAANGVRSGSGTAEDPYLIENWTIDASENHGIWVENTTKHFVVRNSLIENGSLGGVRLENVINGMIENVTCKGNLQGIYLFSSSDTMISNTILENNFFGIFLHGSDNITLSGNTVENSYLGSIYILESTSVTMNNNLIPS